MKFSKRKPPEKEKTEKLYQTLKEIYTNLERTIKNKKDLNDIILKEKRVLETKDTLLNEKPEPFTRRVVIDPILTSIGYKSNEITRDAQQDLGDSKKWSDYTLVIDDDSVLIEAEPLNKDLQAKNTGIDQVRKWILSKKTQTDFGIATNGFQWIMLKFDNDTLQINQLKSIDLRPIFMEFLGQQRFAEKEELLQEFYISFSKESIISTFIDEAVILEEYQEKITKKFYSEYMDLIFGIDATTGSSSRSYSLLTAIKPASGYKEKELRLFAVTLMNRILFTKFLEEKEIVNRNLLKEMWNKYLQIRKHTSKSFYKTHLEPLFFDVLNTPIDKRSSSVLEISYYKDIPYLNGGLFYECIENELKYDIEDDILEKIITEFIEKYEFTIKEEKGINPDILGYIFEKTINYISKPGTNRQKALGAYYSKTDITGYVCRNAIIPFIFQKMIIEYELSSKQIQYLWDLLKKEPDRYINDSIKKGVKRQLPDNIRAGINDVKKRKDWNKISDSEYGLQHETWRGVIFRRRSYAKIKNELKKGKIQNINELITYNLKLIQFSHNAIENCSDYKVLEAFYDVISTISILDTAVGSGAFLFSALNILEPLYEACLTQMQILIKKHPENQDKTFKKFKKILRQVDKHPNRQYFIYKSIIVNNIYGTDIMEEAVEICKLRLFLRLVSQVGDTGQIDPLPDIDFNIQTGNSLIGFVNRKKIREALIAERKVQKKLPLEEDEIILNRIEKRADESDKAFKEFKKLQMEEEIDEQEMTNAKKILIEQLKQLSEELNSYLSSKYGIYNVNKLEYQDWYKVHKPFHWLAEFYSILKKGGFDIVIGNPPYLEINEVEYKPDNLIKTVETRAIHAMFIERNCELLRDNGCISMIVPHALVSTQRMKIVQELLEKKRNVWYANFSWRPGKLFENVNRALTIFVAIPSTNSSKTYSTNYQKWIAETREYLFDRINYTEIPSERNYYWAPKFGNKIENSILKKVLSTADTLEKYKAKTTYRIYYRTTGGLYWKIFTDFPPAFKINGKKGHSSRETYFSVKNESYVKPIIALLSSGLYWWWYTITSNCRDLNPSDIDNFPVPKSIFSDSSISKLGDKYLEDIKKNSVMLKREQKQTGVTETQSFIINKSKLIINKIDKKLAYHYHLTDEEVDFLINYDIKFRMSL